MKGLKKMLANINNISYIVDQDGYNIMVEFSLLPIDTFETKAEAEEFILGYQTGLNTTEAMEKGSMFKYFVEADMKTGVVYRKQVPALRLVR